MLSALHYSYLTLYLQAGQPVEYNVMSFQTMCVVIFIHMSKGESSDILIQCSETAVYYAYVNVLWKVVPYYV